MLTRGSTGSKDSFSLWAPENTWHYNIEGRSATDSADQARRKLSIAERRTKRAGPKGIAFVFDLAFSNGSAMQRMMQPAALKRSTLDQKFTKVLFCERWANAILEHAASKPFRSHRMTVGKVSATPSDSLSHLRAASSDSRPSIQRDMEKHHVLVDLYAHFKEQEHEQTANRKPGRPKKVDRKGTQRRRGYCGTIDGLNQFHKCKRYKLAQRTPYFCQQCKRFFHLPCFFDTHYSVEMK